MQNVYEIITNKILDQLEAGTIPWKRPWKTSPPRNFVSKKVYRGVNLLLLYSSPFSCPLWGTFRQIKGAGGTVNKGEKSTIIGFWNLRELKDKKTDLVKQVPLLRYYRVFNLEQTDGIEIPKEDETDIEPIDRCEEIVATMPGPPSISDDGGNRAYYSPATDSIHMPRRSRFLSAEEHYSTLFHELVHSTGHKSRLCRPAVEDLPKFGEEKYSEEELVAEIGAAFLCGNAGIENSTIENSAAYIKSWLEVLKKEKKLVVVAAAQAQKAHDYILGVEHE